MSVGFGQGGKVYTVLGELGNCGLVATPGMECSQKGEKLAKAHAHKRSV